MNPGIARSLVVLASFSVVGVGAGETPAPARALGFEITEHVGRRGRYGSVGEFGWGGAYYTLYLGLAH